MKINEVMTGLPLRSATQIEITIQAFKTDAESIMIYYELKDDNNIKVCDGYYNLLSVYYVNWGYDNKYIEDIILRYLGLERYGYVKPKIELPLYDIFSGSTSGTTN